MVVKVKLDLKGFDEYLEKIMQAGRNIDAITGRAVGAGGEVLLDGMKRRVPKDTRNLESHLKVDGPHQNGNLHYVEVGLVRGVDPDTARYGNAQEYGTSSMAAQPYVRPALDSDMGKARRAMRDIFEAEEVL